MHRKLIMGRFDQKTENAARVGMGGWSHADDARENVPRELLVLTRDLRSQVLDVGGCAYLPRVLWLVHQLQHLGLVLYQSPQTSHLQPERD